MKLTKNDFKKAGWEVESHFCIKLNKDNYSIRVFLHEDANLCTLFLNDAIISNVEFDIDNLTTIEDIEQTAESMYKAICNI